MIKKMSFRKRLTVSLFFVFLLPVMMGLTFVTMWTIKDAEDNVREGYKAALDSKIEQIDKSFEILYNYSIQLSQQNWVNSFMYMETKESRMYDTYDIAQFSYDLRMFTGTQDFAKEVFVYFINSDVVISSLSRNLEDYDWFIEHTFNASELNEILKSESLDSRIVTLDEVKNYGRSEEGVIVSYPMSKRWSAEEGCVVCFFIPYESISKVLSNNLEEGGLFFVSSEEHIFLMSEMARDVDEKLYEDLLNRDKSMINMDNQMYEVIRAESEYTGWEYIYLLPKHYVNTQKLFHIVVGVGMLFTMGVVGYLMSIAIAYRNSRSVEMLVKKVVDNDLSDTSTNKNEFEQIGEVIDSILETDQSMQSQLDSQRPALKEAYIRCLLEGVEGRKEENIHKSFSILDIDLLNTYYICLVMHSEKDTFGINQILPEDMKFETIKKDKELIYIISLDTLNACNSFYSILQDKSLNLSTTVSGVGQPIEKISEIQKSYQQAVLAREFAEINELNLVIYSEITSSNIEYYFPLEKETAIRNAIRAGDYKVTCRILDELEEKNLLELPVSPSKVRNLYQDLLLVCIKIIGELDASGIIEVNTDIGDCFSKEQYRNHILNIFEELCSFINEKSKHVDVNVRHQVEKYLEQNLTNPNLTRSDVAKEVGLSDSYFGKIFKEQFGINFLNYVNNERIKMAAHLLEQEKTSVSTIGIQVGYESESTFRRLFKKYMGVTPSQYKKAQNI